MDTTGVNWPSITIVLFFFAISVGAIAGARASGNEGLILVGGLAAVTSAVLLMVLKVEKPVQFAKVPQIVTFLFILIGAAVVMLVEWGPMTGVLVGAAYGAILSLALGWTYVQSLRLSRDKSGQDGL